MRKITKWLLLLAVMMMPMLAMSQVMVSQYAMETGTDSTKWVSLPTDTATTKILISNGGDSRASALTDIGFSFYFGGVSYTQFSVNTDGNLRLGSEVTGTSGYSNPFGTALYSNLPKINGMGCDGKMLPGGYVKKAVMGTAPSRVLVVEFKTAKYNWSAGDSSDVMWQVQLFEGTNEVQLVYSSEAPSIFPSEFQIGMASSESDVITVNTALGSVTIGSTSETQSQWPAVNTYYRFYAPSCIRPVGLEVLSISSDTVGFTWERGIQTTWQYTCVLPNATPDWTAVMSVNDTVGVVRDLQPNTDYVIYLRNDCGGDYSDAITIPVHTGCIPLDEPFFDGFEGYSEGMIPNCWTSVNGTSGVYVNDWSEESHTGENALKFGMDDILIAPRVKLAANEMMMVAYVKAESIDAGVLDVGYVTDISGDFNLIKTITPDYNAYQECVIDFSTLGITDTVQPAFRWRDAEYEWYAYYMDDVEIMRIPTCKKPAYAYARNITHNGATIVWEPNEEVASFDVAYGFTDTLEQATRLSVMAGEDSLRLDNLLSDTIYFAWVRNVCDDDSSRWVAVAPFTTKTSCAEVVDLGVSSVGYSSASLYWTVDNSYGEAITSVELSYKLAKDTVWSVPVVVNQSYYVLQGLESGYLYEVRLRARCGEDSSYYAMINFTTNSCGVLLEGDGESNTGNLPIGGYYKYVFSQMLYPADQLSGLDTIKGVAFHIESTNRVQNRMIDVYMGATSRNDLAVVTPYPMDSLTRMVSDVMISTEPGWVTFMFDNPFVYDGSSNLLIAVDDHTGSYETRVYVYKNSTVGVSLYKQSDNKFYNPGDTIVSGMTRMVGTPDIKFVNDCPEMLCDAPSVAFSDITANSIAMNWISNGSESQWLVEYKHADSTNWVSTLVSVANYTISDLMSGTLYDVRVGALCGGDTLYTEMQAFTDCSTQEIPFVEAFDDAIVSCWTVSDAIGWNDNGGKITFGYSGGEYVITPAMSLNLNTLQVLINVSASSTYNGGALVISCGEDPSDVNTFVGIDTIVITAGMPMLQHVISLANYVGAGQYIMVSSFTGSIFVDEIRVEAIPECSMPTDLVASNITADGATINWVDNGGSVEKWEVSYMKSGASAAIVYEVMVDDGPTHTVSGLEANTEYTVSVATICVTGDTNVTVYPISFRTECDVVTLPYFEDFEGIADGQYHLCWFRDNPVTTMNEDYGWDGIKAPAVFIGEHGSNTVILSKDKAIISPLIPLSANQLSVNFDMKVQDTAHSGKLVVGFSTSSSDYSAMTVVDTLAIDTTNWNNYTIDLNGLSVTDTGYIVFKNIENEAVQDIWNAINYYIWLDNINFSQYSSCVRPYNASIMGVSPTTAMVNFSDSVHTNNYTVAWNTVEDIATATTMNVTSTTAQLNNLQSGTTYYAWVRSDCSASEHSAWVYAGSVKTQCNPVVVPYFEDFNDYTYGIAQSTFMPNGYPNHTMPNCWNVVGMNRDGYIPVMMISHYPDFAVSGNVLYLGGQMEDTMFAILPRFVPSTDSLMLSFAYISDASNFRTQDLVLGVMTDPNDASTFVAVKGMQNINYIDTVKHSFVLDENVAPNTNYYIAFRVCGVGASIGFGIDNVKVEYAPTCICPEELRITQVNNTSASITWMGNSSSYEVQYRPLDTTAWTSVTATTNSVTLSNLMDGVKYEMRVRGVCSANDNSEWSRSIEFKTLCNPANIPWSENFESYTTDVAPTYSRPDTYPNHAMPNCWIFSPMNPNDYGGPAAWLTAQPNTSYNTYNTIEGISLRLYSDEQEHLYAALPAMGADIDTLMIRFDYAMASSAAPLKLGVVTNPFDFNTFRSLETYDISTVARTAEHYFRFDNLDPNETYYITFDCGLSWGYTTTLDNIVVDYMPSCIRPGAVRSYVMDNSAIVKWNTLASSSEVVYHENGVDDWTTIVVNADSILLTDLNPTTSYEVVVRSICSTDDTSAWSDTLLFTTECASYDLPFVEDFGTMTGSSLSGMNCWSFYKGLVTNIIEGSDYLIAKTSSNTNWKHEDENEGLNGAHAYINIYGTDRSDWMVTPILNITSGALLSFDVAFVDYLEDAAATDFADDRFYVLATTNNGATWDKLITWGPDADDTYPMDSLSYSRDSISVDLAQYAGQKIRIAFYGESTESGGDNNLHIDNIFVDGIPCGAPANLEATPEAVSAVITWEGDGQNYEIAIREDEVAVWQDSVAVIGLTHTFAGLMPEITYAYRVRQVCGEGLYSDWVEGTFATLPLPCGKPEVTVGEITGDGATFTWAQGENHAEWEVSVFNAMYDTVVDVTEPTFTLDHLQHATEYNVTVRAKCAENVYSEWSDTLQFSTLDCLPVTNVVASEITENSAKISWTAGGEEGEWIVNYGELDFPQGGGTFETVTSTSYVITGLEEETDYDVYVRAVCGEDFTSTWSTPVCQFTTKTGTPEGIDGIEGGFKFTIYPNPTSGMTTISLNGVEGSVTISVVDMNGRTVTSEVMECGHDCEKRLDVAGLAQGSYFVRIVGDEINSVRKLIVR